MAGHHNAGDEVLVRLAADGNPDVRQAVAANPNCPEAHLVEMAADDLCARSREAAAENLGRRAGGTAQPG